MYKQIGSLFARFRIIYPCINLKISLRCSCTQQNQLVGNAGLPKAQKISKAMKIYLERAQAHDTFIKEEIAEFEIGKRHIANIMGLDPENITQEDIDKAIEYLLPSGLFDRRARPKLKHPLEILPKQKAAQFGLDGRPYNSFFYTRKQHYVETLHNISMKINEVKKFEDEQLSLGIRFDSNQQLKLTGSQWLDQKSIESSLNELLIEQEYKTLILALDHLSKLPYSYIEKDLIFQFRLDLKRQNLAANFEKKPPQFDEDGRSFYEAEGKRKKAVGKVKLFDRGSGNIKINGKNFLEYFPKLADREQVLFPLHLSGKLCKVDVEAFVEGGGQSGQAGAIRLAVSRSLQNILPDNINEKLRLAGLLTTDPRILERQKPGQQGARRKYTWKKR